MESFKLWLEQKEIQYLGHGEHAGLAWVNFAIRGKRYEYQVDPAFLQGYSPEGRQFHATKNKAPFVALNLAKKEEKRFKKPRPTQIQKKLF